MLSFFLPILYFFLRIIYMDYSQLNTTCYWCFLYGHQSHHITSFGQLNNNQLTGPIPRELVGISSLKVIDVSKNNLCGTIPTSGPFEHIPLNKLMSMASESSPISVADNEHEDCYVKDGKAKSKVWMHMVKLPTEDKDILKAQCKYCKEIFSAASKNGNSRALQYSKTQGMESCGEQQMDELAWARKHVFSRGNASFCENFGGGGSCLVFKGP
ncbi:uncharacterized protein LOC103718630 isoform X3 [Phoenix dactylifera]|uniref:Uncharacterized protein LOC103718630 isoform X3 n=1 Tax=Phoenix dactylifera TaxID=42345 RepID=A0A8B8ZNQ9_PHODC|nr:uncharacterized protein LOC103718630 isoform X3 [Phoenix dactylifera]